MASIDIFGGSYLAAAWQDVIDPSAPVFEVPYGALHPLFNGFGYQNTDGTYTLFMGEGEITVDENGNASGVVTDIVRLDSLENGLDPDNILAHVWEAFTASGIQDAFLSGGDTFVDVLHVYDDIVTIDSPSFGSFTWSAPAVATSMGNDIVYGSLHHDTIDLGSGDDTAYGDRGNDFIQGGTGDDEIHGDRGHDSIFGNGGDDHLFGGRGRDFIDGGDGHDIISGGVHADEILGGAGNDWLYGDGGDDSIAGNGGNDLIYGGNGDDVIDGHGGRDQIFGDDGNDILNGGTGSDQLNGGEGSDVIHGGRGHDTLVGYDDNDVLYGERGDDVLLGGEGDDLIWGGDGDDTINGGIAGLDTAVYGLPRAYYSIEVDGRTVTVSSMGDEGTDTLVQVERLLFADGFYWL